MELPARGRTRTRAPGSRRWPYGGAFRFPGDSHPSASFAILRPSPLSAGNRGPAGSGSKWAGPGGGKVLIPGSGEDPCAWLCMWPFFNDYVFPSFSCPLSSQLNPQRLFSSTNRTFWCVQSKSKILEPSALCLQPPQPCPDYTEIAFP